MKKKIDYEKLSNKELLEIIKNTDELIGGTICDTCAKIILKNNPTKKDLKNMLYLTYNQDLDFKFGILSENELYKYKLNFDDILYLINCCEILFHNNIDKNIELLDSFNPNPKQIEKLIQYFHNGNYSLLEVILNKSKNKNITQEISKFLQNLFELYKNNPDVISDYEIAVLECPQILYDND